MFIIPARSFSTLTTPRGRISKWPAKESQPPTCATPLCCARTGWWSPPIMLTGFSRVPNSLASGFTPGIRSLCLISSRPDPSSPGGLTRNVLFFSPGYNSPLFCAAPFVFTIHDLSHIYCPENSSPLIRLYYGTVLKRACYRAVSILTVSEFTRMQIVDWSGVSPEKVFNVRCGVDPEYQPGDCSWGPSPSYLLCVSNRKRHKNEFRVVE